MAYADFAAYEAALARGRWFTLGTKMHPAAAGQLVSPWTRADNAASAPTTAAVPARLTSGAFGQPSGAWRLAKVRAVADNSGIGVMIVDRLSHQGGLDATVTSAQTTNLPTAAITRYTSGEGVMAGLEIYTNIGSTGTTVTASYTNTTPTSGRTTEAVAFGGAGKNLANAVIVLPLQSGDTGVTSVESVTVLATTGTSGNFGVTLFMPLTGPLPVAQNPDNESDYEFDLFMRTGSLPLVVSDACLTYFALCQTNNSNLIVDIFLIPE